MIELDAKHIWQFDPRGVDFDLTRRFEARLDPARPDVGDITASVIGYGDVADLIQPYLDPSAFGNAVLRTADDKHVREMLRAALCRIAALYQSNTRTSRPEVGLDAQISNWAWLRDHHGTGRPSTLARKGDESIVPAGIAMDAQKSTREDPALEIGADLSLDKPRDGHALPSPAS